MKKLVQRLALALLISSAFIATLTVISPAHALDLSARKKIATDPNGNPVNVVRAATGATARVAAKYQAAFQGYIRDLEAAGATIKFMGGIRGGHCSSGSKHPCGMAMDICQYARGVVDRRCNLPSRPIIAQIAARHGLFEGGQWCNHDYGHVEAGGSSSCHSHRYASRKKHRRTRVAAYRE